MAKIKIPHPNSPAETDIYLRLPPKVRDALFLTARQNGVTIRWAVIWVWSRFYVQPTRLRREAHEALDKTECCSERVHLLVPARTAEQMRKEAARFEEALGTVFRAAWDHYVELQGD